jgi:hypothetical protein
MIAEQRKVVRIEENYFYIELKIYRCLFEEITTQKVFKKSILSAFAGIFKESNKTINEASF